MTSTDASYLTGRGHEDRYQQVKKGDPSRLGSQDTMLNTSKMSLDASDIRSSEVMISTSEAMYNRSCIFKMDIHESTCITEARGI